jgi:general secretion pathway protein J
MIARRRPADGFALVEALASLVVVSLIGLMILEGVGVGRRVWERIDIVEARGEAVDGAQTLLRDRMEQIYPATLYDQAAPYVDFAGSDERVTFLSSPPYWERPSPLKRYVLRIEGRRLVLVSTSDVAPRSAAPSTLVLLDHVRRLDLAYFGAAQPDGQRRWRAAWFNEGVLPEVVRIRVRFERGDPRLWPDLIVHPRATIDSGCVFNRISRHCKGRI